MAVGFCCACSGRPWNDPWAGPGDANILYRVFNERPKTLDPASAYSESEAQFTAQIYEPLVQYHFLRRPYELVPLTAATVPKPTYLDAAGRTLAEGAPENEIARVVYRVRIRPGIEYQPHPAFARDDAGHLLYHSLTPADLVAINTLADFPITGSRELIAADYVYQIKRLVHPRLHSPIAALMRRYLIGMEDLSNELAASAARGEQYLDLREFSLPGARALDRYTLEISLAKPYPQFVYWLAMPFFAPIPWEADAFYSQRGMAERNLSFAWYPLGTGPYLLAENNPNRRMILQRNPNFRGETYPSDGEMGDAARGWLDSAGQTMPFVDTIYFNLEKEDIPEWNKFLQGYYDASVVVSDSFDQAIRYRPDGTAELTAEMQAQAIQLITTVQATINYVGFNMMDPVVGGDSERARYLRRAISIAVDIEELISIFLNGRGAAAQGPIPPGIFGHRDGEAGINPYVYEWRNGRARRRGVAEALLWLEKAGYRKGRDPRTGRPLVLYFDTVSSGPDSKALMNWYRKQFSKLGIDLVLRATDYNRFQEKIRSGSGQIFAWGWNADYPDPENFLFLLFGPYAKVVSQGENAANYTNETFDQHFVRMRNLPNGDERQAVIDEMTALVRRDAPWIWGYHPKAYTLHHSWYRNAKPNLMARNTMKYHAVDAMQRAAKRRAWNEAVIGPVLVIVGLLLLSVVPAYLVYRHRQRATVL